MFPAHSEAEVPGSMANLINELKRRNVFRVAAAYLVLAWILLQITETVGGLFALPEWTPKLLVYLLAIGFLPALVAAWRDAIRDSTELAMSDSLTGLLNRRAFDREMHVAVARAERFNRGLSLIVLVIDTPTFGSNVPDPQYPKSD